MLCTAMSSKDYTLDSLFTLSKAWSVRFELEPMKRLKLVKMCNILDLMQG